MCTLTYINDGNTMIITSNRDEQTHRSDVVLVTEKGYSYLKDPLKGGSWFTFSKDKILVLLNGAFEKHVREASYAKSRGIILLECMESEDSTQYLEDTSFENIEPFTVVNIGKDEIVEFRWDGTNKYFYLKDAVPQIWSSATLYDHEAREMRKELFAEASKNNASDMWRFHTTPIEDTYNGIVMERPEISLKTISTTQLVITNEGLLFKNVDHMSGQEIKYLNE